MHDYRRVPSARRIIRTIVLPSGNEPRGLIDGGWLEFQAPGQIMRSWRGSALGRAGLWTKRNSPPAGMRSQWRRGNSVHVFDAGRPLVGSPSWLMWRRLPVKRCAPWSHPFDKFCSNLHVFPVSKGLGIQDQTDRSTDGPWACSASKLTAGPHGKCRWPCGSRAPRWRGFAPGAWRGMERGFSVGGAKWVRRPHPSLWPLSTTPNPNMESALAGKKRRKLWDRESSLFTLAT